MLHQMELSKLLNEIDRLLRESAARHQFGLLTVRDLRDTLKKKGVNLNMDCRIYEVCNPMQAKRVLETDATVSAALPCRISVYGSTGAYTLAAIPRPGC